MSEVENAAANAEQDDNENSKFRFSLALILFSVLLMCSTFSNTTFFICNKLKVLKLKFVLISKMKRLLICYF